MQPEPEGGRRLQDLLREQSGRGGQRGRARTPGRSRREAPQRGEEHGQVAGDVALDWHHEEGAGRKEEERLIEWG